MKLKFNIIALLLVVTLFGCKKAEKELSEFKFSEKGIVLNCNNFDLKLLNEAVFAFEDDITKYYGKDKPNLTRAYSQFIRNANYSRLKYEDILSPHTVKIFEVLKEKKELWDVTSPKSKLDYNTPIFKCIAENITNKDLKTTLNALISTNSMSPKVFGPAVLSNYSTAVRDKYLAAYIALDLYYAKLFDTDLTKVVEKPEPKVDFNKVPPTQTQVPAAKADPHAGHDH